jgi:hypothetical protein
MVPRRVYENIDQLRDSERPVASATGLCLFSPFAILGSTSSSLTPFRGFQPPKATWADVIGLDEERM